MAIDYKVLADYLLDGFIDMNGLEGAVQYLMGYGFEKEELLELGFELETIENAMQDLDEDYREENMHYGGLTSENKSGLARRPFWNYAYQVALDDYNFSDDEAHEVAEFADDIYTTSNVPLDGIYLVEFICENFYRLPDKYSDIVDFVIDAVREQSPLSL